MKKVKKWIFAGKNINNQFLVIGINAQKGECYLIEFRAILDNECDNGC